MQFRPNLESWRGLSIGFYEMLDFDLKDTTNYYNPWFADLSAFSALKALSLTSQVKNWQ